MPRILANWIVVQVPDYQDLSTGVKGHNGEELVLGVPTDQPHKERYARTHGEVLMVPEKLRDFHPGQHLISIPGPTGDEYTGLSAVPMAVQVGDVAWFDFDMLSHTFSQEMHTVSLADLGIDVAPGMKGVKIPYYALWCVQRDNTYVPLNGYVMVEPIEEQAPVSALAIEVAQEKELNTGIIRHIGPALKGEDGYGYSLKNHWIAQGMKVAYRKRSAVRVTIDRKVWYFVLQHDVYGYFEKLNVAG